MRSDAAPLGYIDNQGQVWTGYCSNLADSLGEYLTEELDIPGAIEVKKIPSTLENRFKLVANNTVHLECGSNTISPDKTDVTFSNTAKFLQSTYPRTTFNLRFAKHSRRHLYGLILSQGESKWNGLVNDFLDSDRVKDIDNVWFKDYSEQALADADYCLNRRK